MFCPMKMSKVSVLMLGRHLNRVTVALGDSGLIHLIDATSDSDGSMMNALDMESEVRNLEDMIGRIDTLLENLGVDEDYQVPEMPEIKEDEIEALIEKVEGLYTEQNNQLLELMKRKNGLVKKDGALAGFPFQTMRLERLKNLSHLYVVMGTMEEADLLYGVTMQEKGISTVIELDLEDAQKAIEE